MTNAEIIGTAMAMHDIDIELEVDTFAGWKRRGYSVKKGEHAAFQTKLWKPSKFKVDQNDDDEQTADNTQTKDGKKKYTNKLILVNASFFTEEQVQRVAVG